LTVNLSSPKNAFLNHKLDDTLALPPGDVPELHADVLERCAEAIEQAQQAGQGSGLLLVGEAGSGKSHLIAQLRQQVAAKPTAALAAIPLRGAFSGRLWRHLREQLVAELLRDYPDQKYGANGMLRVLRNRFPKWASAARGASGGLLEWLVGQPRPEHDLQAYLDEFARECQLDYGLRKVLPRLGVANLRGLAHSWLRGEQLGNDDLTKLGLPPGHPSEQEQEKNAREVILSLLCLPGDRTVLVLCFDEVEAIQAGTCDAAALRQFATLLTDLLAQAGPRVVITFIRPTLLIEMRKSVDISNMQKAFPEQGSIPPLTWEQSVQIVRSRLDAEPTCRAGRQQHPGDLDWPLVRRFVEETFQASRRSLTPRHLIMACRLEFDRLSKGKRASGAVMPQTEAPASGPAPQTASLPSADTPGLPQSAASEPDALRVEEFSRAWERQRKKLLGRMQGIQFDTVMAIGLPWLVRLNNLAYVRAEDQDHRLGDVNLLFQPFRREDKAVGISFCNHQPRCLWRRLDRLRSQWTTAAGKCLGTLVVLRSEAEPTTQASLDRLAALRKTGVRVVSVERQQLAEMAAFQALLTAALEGDLTKEGKPVEAAGYDTWAQGHLSESVKELLQLVFEPPTPAPAQAAAKEKRPRATHTTR
jgi:AAA ATPase domain